MEVKYNGIWLTNSELETVVFESYIPTTDIVHIIYLNDIGSFMPYILKKQYSPQWKLPFWTAENTKAIFPSLELAKEYLVKYEKNFT